MRRRRVVLVVVGAERGESFEEAVQKCAEWIWKGNKAEVDDHVWRLERRWDHGEPQTSGELRADDRSMATKRRLMQQGRSVDGPDWRVPHLVWSVCGQAVTSVWPNFETLYDGVWRDGTTLHFYPREQTAGPTHPLRVTAARRFQRPGNLFKLTRRVAERWTAPSHFLIIWMWVRARSPHSALQNGLRIVRKSPSHYGCKSDHGDGRKILWQLEGGNIALFQSKL